MASAVLEERVRVGLVLWTRMPSARRDRLARQVDFDVETWNSPSRWWTVADRDRSVDVDRTSPPQSMPRGLPALALNPERMLRAAGDLLVADLQVDKVVARSPARLDDTSRRQEARGWGIVASTQVVDKPGLFESRDPARVRADAWCAPATKHPLGSAASLSSSSRLLSRGRPGDPGLMAAPCVIEATWAACLDLAARCGFAGSRRIASRYLRRRPHGALAQPARRSKRSFGRSTPTTATALRKKTRSRVTKRRTRRRSRRVTCPSSGVEARPLDQPSETRAADRVRPPLPFRRVEALP